MKATGIIVEYNPLHNGHIHHIRETRKRSGCDVLIAVMSSSFTQRGEPTILDKFTRTQWALNNGVDLVVELPFVFGVQNADLFAKAAINILHHLDVKDIYFGSESGDIQTLESLGELLDSETYNANIQEYLKEGYSYPTASAMAMNDIHQGDGFDQPNNILGIQYIRAGKELDPTIQCFTIQRIDTGYYEDINPDKKIQSATSIRRLAQHNEAVSSYVPSDVADDLMVRKLVSFEDFMPALAGILHRATPDELGDIHHVTEGLEHRIKQLVTFDTMNDLIQQVISRRYTHAKLQRMIAHILCNVKESDITSTEIPYLRILGMTDAGRAHLNHIKKTVSIPLYTKIKEGLHPYLDIELRVSKVYNIASDIDVYKREFEPVIF